MSTFLRLLPWMSYTLLFCSLMGFQGLWGIGCWLTTNKLLRGTWL